jgi:predicted PurR-regulated permease PerM
MTVATEGPRRDRVPVRTIATTIAMVLVTVLLLLVIREVSRVLTWIVVAIFFSVALYPLVGWVDRRVTGGR